MKTQDTVDWFQLGKTSSRYRAIKWSVAFLCAIFFNLLYLEGLPSVTSSPVSKESDGAADEGAEEFLIELSEEPPENRYVETNPDSVINEPDETVNISNRNQQAAQEDVAGPDDNEDPYLEGEDTESAKIIEGAIPREGEDSPAIQTYTNQAQPSQPAPEPQQARQGSESQRNPSERSQEQQQQQQQQQPQEQQQAQEEQKASPQSLPSLPVRSVLEELPAIPPPPPTPDFIEEVEPESDDGLEVPIIEEPEEPVEEYSKQDAQDATLNINIPPSVAQQISKAQKELREQREQQRQDQQQANEQAQQQQQAPQSPQPMPRPRLNPKVLPGPLMQSQTYAARVGPIGFDAKFSQFGYYLQRMFETIQLQWYSLLDDITIGQENRPAFVVIEYDIDSEGNVVESRVLDTNAGDLATLLCKDAIESRAPFGPWTRQMVDQLGEQQTITLRFIYL